MPPSDLTKVDQSIFALWTFYLIHLDLSVVCREIKTMKQRFNDFKAAPDAYKAMSGLETYRQWCRRRVSSKRMLALALLITSTLIITTP